MLSKEQLSQIQFVNLVQHTHFSMPFGVGNVKAHIKKVAASGLAGFAMTDTNMGGVLEAYKAVKDKKLPFALGVQLNIIDDLQRQDKVNKYFTITCFAKNQKGYQNLVALTSIASTPDHFYYKPRISLPELIEHSEGVVVLSGDINGMLSQSIVRETGQEEILMQIFKDHFGDDFYLEMHFHNLSQQWDKDTKSYKDSGMDVQKTVNLKLVELARKYKVKCVLVQNSFMPNQKDKLLQDILIGNTPIGKDGWRFSNTYNTMSVEEMYERVQKEAPYISDEQFVEWSNNSILVLNKCKDIKLAFTPKLPKIKYEESVVNQDPVWEEKFQALKKDLKTRHQGMYELFEVSEGDISLKTSFKIMMRNEKVDFNNVHHLDRLVEELLVIQRNGIIKLCDYFLLLEDVTHFVRSNGYLRGFGRGCITENTTVLIKRFNEKGIVNLNKVQIGDEVLTDKGTWEKVIQTFTYDVNEMGLKLTQQNGESITLTKDHKILVIKNKNRTFIPASELTIEDLVVVVNEESEEILNIIKIEETMLSSKVYDLMIANTPSFLTNFGTVHNSGAGSLVAYALDITDCDPLHFELLFERFLTKERIGKFNFELPGYPMSEYGKSEDEK